MTTNQRTTRAPPSGTEAVFSVTCKDVVTGRGSGAQNHCGNVTYRKLVSLNKELYTTSSKFHKLEISKAVVAAVREYGGRFLQADWKRGGLYFDIGDKRAWHKTSQALREGQAEVRACMVEEDPTGRRTMAKYNRIIRERKFFAYACRMMESLHHPAIDESGIPPCGQQCPLALRQQNFTIMQMFAPPPKSCGVQQDQHCNAGMDSQWAYQGNSDCIEPLPLNTPLGGADAESYEPLPHSPRSSCDDLLSLLSKLSGSNKNSRDSLPADSFEPLPYKNETRGPPRPELPSNGISGKMSSGVGSLFSMQNCGGKDFEITPEEGKVLMEQLNQEVDLFMRRKTV